MPVKRHKQKKADFEALLGSWDYAVPESYRPEDRVYTMRAVPGDARFRVLWMKLRDEAVREAFNRALRDPNELKKLPKSWVAPRVTGKISTWNDCPMVGDYFPAFSERAVECLRDLLEPHGVILPLRSIGKRYFAFVPRPLKNVLDMDRSAISWRLRINRWLFPEIFRYEFKSKNLSGIPIFSIARVPQETYVTDLFVQRVKECGLIGFNFHIVYPLRTGVDWRKLALKTLRLHWSEGLPKGQKLSGVRVEVKFLIENPNLIPTLRQEKQIAEWGRKVDDELVDPNSFEPPIGYLHSVLRNAGDCGVMFCGCDAEKIVAIVQRLIPTACWAGKVRIAKTKRVFDPWL